MRETSVLQKCLFLGSLVFAGAAHGTDVLSYHNDAQSTGQNLTETSLTPTSVTSGNFSRQFMTLVDGQVYAQPLYKEGVDVVTGPNAGLHNLVFVATQHDSVYAIDADSGAVIWQTSLLATGLPGATAITTMPGADTSSGDIAPEIGVTATPVIDPATGYLYVEAKTKQIIGGDATMPTYVHGIYVLDITNANVTPNANVVASNLFVATINVNGANTTYAYRTETDPSAVQDPFVFGAGYANETNAPYTNRVYFNGQRELARPGLILANGVVYACYGSHGDNGPYHGWMLGFNKVTLALTAALNTTPNGGLGGIWQGAGIPAMDAAGYFYVETGNGDFDTTLTPQGFPINSNFSDSFLKIAIDGTTTQANQNPNGWGLKIADYFSPYNNQTLDGGDTDVGSGGPLVLPDSVGSPAHPRLLIGGGKEGTLYLIDRDNMGHFNTSTDNVVQSVAAAVSGILDTGAYFNGVIYYAGGYNNDVGKAFSMINGALSNTPIQETPDTFGFAGSTPSISANGTNNGVVWMIDNGSHELRAYAASNLSDELYTSGMAGTRDQLTGSTKFSVPTVADGYVFVGIGVNNSGGGENALAVFGPPIPPTSPPAAPSALTATAVSGIEIQLSWTDNSTNEDGFSIEESTDGVNFTQIGTVGVNVVSYQVTGLQLSVTYYFRVRAYNSYQGLSDSAYTNTAHATTNSAAPTINFSNGFAASGGEAGQMQYNGNATINGTRLELTTSTPTFQAASVFAKALQDVRQFSAQFSFQLSNAQADGFTFCMQSNSSVDLGGNGGNLGYAGMGNSVAVYFDLFAVPNSTGLLVDGAVPAEAGSIDLTGTGINLLSGDIFNVALVYDGVNLTETITDTQTNATVTETYPIDIPGTVGTVAYLGFTGGTGGLTAVQDVLTWTYTILASSPPAAPTFLAGGPASGTEIDLRWSDNSINESGFVIERSSDGVAFAQVGEAAIDATSYNDTGLSPGSAYYYRVYATNNAGSSDDSNVLLASTPTAPNTPSGAHATNVTTTEIDLAWQDNANNEQGFRILRSSDGANFSTIAMLPPGITSFSDRHLNSGATYDYHIEAYNLAGYQDFTGATVTTLSLVGIVANSAAIQEGTGTPGTLTVSRQGQTTNPLTVSFETATGDGQAAAPARYTLAPSANSVTIPAGATTAAITVQPGSDATVLGTQVVTLNVTPAAGYVPAAPASASLQVLDSPINQWKSQQFGSADAAQSAGAADNAAPAGDGIANLVKYALGLPALVPAAASLPVSFIENIGGANYLALAVVRPDPAPTDVTYHIETTGDLTSGLWTPAIIDSGSPTDNGNGTETLRAHDSQPESPGTQRFIRLRVTRP